MFQLKTVRLLPKGIKMQKKEIPINCLSQLQQSIATGHNFLPILVLVLVEPLQDNQLI